MPHPRAALCASWDHQDQDEPTEAGFLTCALHRTEEAQILRVRGEIDRVGDQIREYESRRPRHPDEAKDFLEDAIRHFFDLELEPQLGLSCGSGYRSHGDSREQLDVILSLSEKNPSDWNCTMRVCSRAEEVELGMHMEVAYRSSDSDIPAKLREDAAKVQRSIQGAVGSGRRPPWTALILLGSTWATRRSTIVEVIHELSHAADAPVKTGGFEYWPYVDAVVTPAGTFKKHTLFDSSACSESDREWPCYLPVPSPTDDPLQGLAVARAYLIHRIRVMRHMPGAEDERVWSPQLDSAILGPVHQFRQMEVRGGDEVAGFLASDCPEARCSLWHLGYERRTGSRRPIEQCLRDSPICSRGSRYTFLPRAALRA